MGEKKEKQYAVLKWRLLNLTAGKSHDQHLLSIVWFDSRGEARHYRNKKRPAKNIFYTIKPMTRGPRS